MFERARNQPLNYVQVADELGMSANNVEQHFAAAMLHIVDPTDPEGGAECTDKSSICLAFAAETANLSP